MSAAQKFEALAAQWDGGQRPARLLLSGYDLIRLRCWSWSDGGKADGMSDALRAFLKASNDAQPEDWLDDYLSEREACSVCSESYRLENLSLCTGCSRRYCYRCAATGTTAGNGNRACGCGGEVVG